MSQDRALISTEWGFCRAGFLLMCKYPQISRCRWGFALHQVLSQFGISHHQCRIPSLRFYLQDKRSLPPSCLSGGLLILMSRVMSFVLIAWTTVLPILTFSVMSVLLLYTAVNNVRRSSLLSASKVVSSAKRRLFTTCACIWIPTVQLRRSWLTLVRC